MAKSKKPSFPLHLDRNHLPEPECRFPNWKIGMYATESTADFPPAKQAPEGAPNVLLVLLDDVGFGWPSVNGGLVRTPTAERLAKRGLFYNQFHTTALCSPTRAAMLTGRNHHSVATGVIQEMATGHPGYCGIIPKSCATVAELLKQAGYTCAWSGRTTTFPTTRRAPRARSITGPPTRVSITSMDSLRVRLISSIRHSSATPSPSSRQSDPKRATSSPVISPTS